MLDRFASGFMDFFALIKRIFGGGPEPKFIHPNISELTYDGFAWRTSNASDLDVSIFSSRQGPDERLIKLATVVLSRLSEFELSARNFIDKSFTTYVSSLNELAGVEFMFPNKSWLRQEWTVTGNLSIGDPIFVLQFELNADRNVLDVIFQFEKPIDVDYH